MDFSPAAAPSTEAYAGYPRAIRKIGSQRDLVEFVQSEAFAGFMGFILELNAAIRGKAIQAKEPSALSPVPN